MGHEQGGPAVGRHYGNRHGRSERARQAVLEAADDLVAAKGFAGVTMEEIASSAGVAKQSIYRWWSSKTDVLLEAFLQDAAQHLTPADSGDVDRDLRVHLRQLADFLSHSDPGAVFKALIGHAQHDHTFAETFRTRFLDEQRRRDRLPLDRAVQRGQIPADVDVATELDRMVGPIYYRVLVTGEPVDADFTDHLVDGFLSLRPSLPPA